MHLSATNLLTFWCDPQGIKKKIPAKSDMSTIYIKALYLNLTFKYELIKSWPWHYIY